MKALFSNFSWIVGEISLLTVTGTDFSQQKMVININKPLACQGQFCKYSDIEIYKYYVVKKQKPIKNQQQKQVSKVRPGGNIKLITS